MANRIKDMEKGAHKVQNVAGVTFAGMEGTRDGKLPKRSVESSDNAELYARENNNSGQTWISVHVIPLSDFNIKKCTVHLTFGVKRTILKM